MFKLLKLPSQTSSLLSILLRTRSAQRLSSQHVAAVPTPNIAELVPSGFFFLSTTMVFNFRRSEPISQEKHQQVHVDRHLVTGKETSSKINFYKQLQRSGGLEESSQPAMPASQARYSAGT